MSLPSSPDLTWLLCSTTSCSRVKDLLFPQTLPRSPGGPIPRPLAECALGRAGLAAPAPLLQARMCRRPPQQQPQTSGPRIFWAQGGSGRWVLREETHAAAAAENQI